MANNDSTLSTGNKLKQRLIAVMDYYGIPIQKRASHLATVSGYSASTVRRFLNGNYDIGSSRGPVMFDLANGLNVHWRWIYDGKFEKFDPRTARIQLVMIDGENPERADLDIGSIASEVPGEPIYGYIGEPVDLSSAILLEQHRRMTKWEKHKNIRFMIRLANNDPKAERWLEMYSRGQINRQQIFCMV